jgi:membrane fusion protein (multidrug efflux system)
LNSVNTRTGTLEVQASFRNADHTVLPGQFVRVRVRTGARSHALLVPQRAVQELQGQHSVLIVAADNTVHAQSVVTGDRLGERWIVEQGLKDGDAVVVDGVQKIRPGASVTPRPFHESTAPNGR